MKLTEKFNNLVFVPIKHRPVAIFACIALIFIILRLYFPIEPLLVLSFIIGLVLVLLNYDRKVNSALIVFICFAMVLGIFSADLKVKSIKNAVNFMDGKFARVEGSVTTVPTTNTLGTSFYLDCDVIKTHKGKYNKDIKLYVDCNNNKEISYGDKISFNCRLYNAEFANEKFGKNYLAKGAPLVARDVTIVNLEKYGLNRKFIYIVRNYIFDISNKFFADDARELFKALIAGDQSGFSKELKANLAGSGLSHVASVSGLHVSIIGMLFYNLIKRKNRHAACLISIVAVFIFTFIAGALPAAMRSAIMFTSFMAAKLFLTENDSFTALCVAALILVGINPYIIYDWGFILSFLSVLGIVIFYKGLRNAFKFMPGLICESVALTISSQLMTIPALSSMFGYLSVYSVLSNIVISAVFLWILCFSFAFVFLSVIPGINRFAAVICTFLLDIVSAVANLFADLPMSVISIKPFDVPMYIVYYILVILFAAKDKISLKVMTIVLLLCSVILIFS